MIERPAKPVALLLAFLSVLVLLLTRATVARGEGAPRRVVGVLAVPGDPLVERLRAELEGVGYDVIATGSPDRDASRAAIEVLAERLGATGLLRVVPPEGEVEVWVIDRVAGSTRQGRATLVEVVRPQIVTGETSEADEHPVMVLAVRAVEILRASLAEIDAGKIPIEVARPARASNVPRTRVTRDPGPFALRTGPGLLWSGASSAAVISQPLAAVLAEASWVPSRVGVRAFLVAPLSYGKASGAEGSARIRPWTLGFGGRVELARHHATVQPSLGAGVALTWLRVNATAAFPYTTTTDTAYALLPFVDARIALRITRDLTFASDVLVGYAVAEPTVRFAGRSVAGWGRPAISVVPISAELSFP